MSKLHRIAACVAALSLSASAQAVNLVHGQQLYNLHCARCHGITGIPVMPDTPNLSQREGMNQPDVVLMQSIKVGKKTMPPYIGILNDNDILDVLQYIRNIR
ncbi:MAG TPA: cytochrome c [Rhodocyclaceae bacterium]